MQRLLPLHSNKPHIVIDFFLKCHLNYFGMIYLSLLFPKTSQNINKEINVVIL